MAVNRAGRVARTSARAGVSSVDRPNTVGLSGRELAAVLDGCSTRAICSGGVAGVFGACESALIEHAETSANRIEAPRVRGRRRRLLRGQRFAGFTM